MKEKLDLSEAELRTHQMSEALREMREPMHAEAGPVEAMATQPEAFDDRRAATPFMKELSNDATKTISRITGIAQLLKHKKDSKDQAALLKQLNAYARRLDYTVADIADADKLARGTIQLQPKKLDLEALVNRLVEESGISNDHEVRIITDPVKIRLDAQRTEQIVAGLLRNAGDRTPNTKSIVVRLQHVDGGATISVEDPEPSSDASMSPVVRRFAEVQGGWAKVESREGGGSIFRVHLPDAGIPEGTVPPELQIMVEGPQDGAEEDPWEPTTAEQILSRELRRLAELEDR
jgi:signal transduction histidine kinase